MFDSVVSLTQITVEHTHKGMSQIAFMKKHIFSPGSGKQCVLCTIMCNSNKSWLTGRHIDRGLQIHKASLHKSNYFDISPSHLFSVH